MIVFLMKNKFFFNKYIHSLILLISALSFSISLDISMPDDGLRHIAFAYNKDIMHSWGEVFPYSLFGSYDPWFMWHNLLAFFSNFIPIEYVHILINTLSLFFLMLLIAQYIKNEIKYEFSSMLYIVVISLVFLTASRYLMVRPDLLSGLYVMAALLLSNRFIYIFILTILYAPFYYLFFMYTGSIGLVYLIQKKWNAFWGVFLASCFSLILFLLHDLENYLQTVINILTDQKLRMGLEVGEGKALFSFLSNVNYFVLLAVFFGISSYIIYKNYKYFKSNNIALFLLITSILWVNQARYFYLFLPLFVIYFLSIILNANKKSFFYNLRKKYLFMIKNVNYAKKSMIFYLIAIPYCIAVFSYVYNGKSLNKEINEAVFFKDKAFDNKTILSNRLHEDMYKAVYLNPKIHFVPSCSVGWFSNENENIKDIYIRMQKEEGISELELSKLVKYVNADIYIHYLRNDKQVLNFEKLNNLGIIPLSIYHNRIIFKIKKEMKNNE